MKFKAELRNAVLFARIVACLERVERRGVMKLSREQVSFVSVNTNDNLQSWASIDAAALFSSSLVESLNRNEIFLELEFGHLSKALKSAMVASSVGMKLTKRDGVGYLSFVIQTTGSQNLRLSQEIPIKVLSGTHAESLNEPTLPEPDVQVLLPPLRDIKVLIERFKVVDDVLHLEANSSGTLTMKAEAPFLVVGTDFEKLQIPVTESSNASNEGTVRSCRVAVDVKKFARILPVSQLGPEHVILSMVEERSLVLSVVANSLFMTYYIPVIIT